MSMESENATYVRVDSRINELLHELTQSQRYACLLDAVSITLIGERPREQQRPKAEQFAAQMLEQVLSNQEEADAKARDH